MKKQKVTVAPFDPNQICLISIKKHLPLYIEFFDQFIAKFMPHSRTNSKLKDKVGEAAEARMLAGTALHSKGVSAQGFEQTEQDLFKINKTFNDINQFQRTL